MQVPPGHHTKAQGTQLHSTQPALRASCCAIMRWLAAADPSCIKPQDASSLKGGLRHPCSSVLVCWLPCWQIVLHVCVPAEWASPDAPWVCSGHPHQPSAVGPPLWDGRRCVSPRPRLPRLAGALPGAGAPVYHPCPARPLCTPCPSLQMAGLALPESCNTVICGLSAPVRGLRRAACVQQREGAGSAEAHAPAGAAAAMLPVSQVLAQQALAVSSGQPAVQEQSPGEELLLDGMLLRTCWLLLSLATGSIASARVTVHTNCAWPCLQ